MAEDTIEGYVKRLRFIAKNTDITKPETVKEFILNQTTSSAHKEALANAYAHYIQCYGLNWEKPFFHREERLPNVPTTEQVNTIISAFKKKYATIFSILRDTGLRPCELHRLTLKMINLENGTITPQTAKNGAPRILTLPAPTLAMLKEYITRLNPKMNERFFPTTRRMCHIWVHGRNQVAEKLKQSNLQIPTIRLKTLLRNHAICKNQRHTLSKTTTRTQKNRTHPNLYTPNQLQTRRIHLKNCPTRNTNNIKRNMRISRSRLHQIHRNRRLPNIQKTKIKTNITKPQFFIVNSSLTYSHHVNFRKQTYCLNILFKMDDLGRGLGSVSLGRKQP